MNETVLHMPRKNGKGFEMAIMICEMINKNMRVLVGSQEIAPIVRCKECVKRETGECPCNSTGDPYLDWKPDDMWFCADGKRKDGDSK